MIRCKERVDEQSVDIEIVGDAATVLAEYWAITEKVLIHVHKSGTPIKDVWNFMRNINRMAYNSALEEIKEGK